MCLSTETRKAISAVLAKKKITQVDLAEKLGVSQPYINNILNGRQTISMATADKIVAALGCRIRIKLQDKK